MSPIQGLLGVFGTLVLADGLILLSNGRRRARRLSDGDLAYAVHVATLLVVAALSLLFAAKLVTDWLILEVGFVAIGLTDIGVGVATRRSRRDLG